MQSTSSHKEEVMFKTQLNRLIVLAVTGGILVASFAPMALAYGRH